MLGSLLLVVVVLVPAALYVRWTVSMVQRSRHTKAAWVVRHLERNGTYTVRVGPFTSIWTPERPSSDVRLPMGFHQMPGRGVLTYSLGPDSETVRLVWRSKAGSQREWIGPVPVVATVDYQSAMHRGKITALLLVVVLAAGGAVLGTITGSILAGLAGGLVAGYFVGSTVVGGRQMEAFRSAYELRRKQAGPGPSPAPTGGEFAGINVTPVEGGSTSKRHRAMRAVFAIYGAVMTLGFALGFVLASGSGVRRFLFGIIGLLLAIAIMSTVSGLIRLRVARMTPKHPGTGETPLS